MQRLQETIVEEERETELGELINKSHNFAAREKHGALQVALVKIEARQRPQAMVKRCQH